MRDRALDSYWNFSTTEPSKSTDYIPNSCKSIRQKLKMTQADFAERFGLSLSAIRDWEQGRSQPDRTAQSLLKIVDKAPDVAAQILSSKSSTPPHLRAMEALHKSMLRSKNTDYQEPKLVFKNTEPAFLPVMNWLMTIKSFSCLVETYNSDEQVGRPWNFDDYASFHAMACEKEIIWYARGAIDLIASNIIPLDITFECKDLKAEKPTHLSSYGVLSHFMHSANQSLIIKFFEDNKHMIINRDGNIEKRINWPDPWRFAFVIRNALSHNGSIKISDSDGLIVWNNLEYSSKDNGRHIFDIDISSGDILFLLKDMQNFITN
jgi:DNA-binding transcriptional regulator YiaG